MSETTDKKAIKELHEAMDMVTDTAKFIGEFEALTNNRVTGAADNLKQANGHIYNAIVAIAAGSHNELMDTDGVDDRRDDSAKEEMRLED